MNKQRDLRNKIFFSKYRTIRKLGEGSFGQIYECVNITTNERCAIKFEEKSSGCNLLEAEAYIMCYLKGNCIPIVKSYGVADDYSLLIMELLGASLENLLKKFNYKFPLKTVCMVTISMLERIQFVHDHHIIHRDLKPDNFVVGLGENINKIYLIDFGLAKKYRSAKTMEHIKFVNKKKLTGTARYASRNALNGYEQSRRDDLESIGYIALYMLKGKLPWQGLKIEKKDERYSKIGKIKNEISDEEEENPKKITGTKKSEGAASNYATLNYQTERHNKTQLLSCLYGRENSIFKMTGNPEDSENNKMNAPPAIPKSKKKCRCCIVF